MSRIIRVIIQNSYYSKSREFWILLVVYILGKSKHLITLELRPLTFNNLPAHVRVQAHVPLDVHLEHRAAAVTHHHDVGQVCPLRSVQYN